MKTLSKEEFIDRSQAFLRARKIFIDSKVTNNLTVAFELYQAILAEKDREIQITTDSVEAYLEELCPNCGKKLKKYKKCCGNPDGYVGCNCGYKVIPAGDGDGSPGATVVSGGPDTAAPGVIDPSDAVSV